jgi:Heparinase II/III-like protein/Heparinase II/III N-terminus
MLKKIALYFYTVKYLRWTQLRYRVFYGLRQRIRAWQGFRYPTQQAASIQWLNFEALIDAEPSWDGQRTFTFLNISHTFSNEIDWNLGEYGLLWNYNLHYFEWLRQPELDPDRAQAQMEAYAVQWSHYQVATSPYPLSLRGMNWIQFLCKHRLQAPNLHETLAAQYEALYDQIEYHILGNHLLENAFSLLWGAYFFRSEKYFSLAKKIFEQELPEQILPDGAHFELSPMYHQLMLGRLLDVLNLIQHNVWPQQSVTQLYQSLKKYASLMCGWLENIGFINGDIPLFNDAANGIAPSSKSLFDYAKRLSVQADRRPLGQSGYRKWTSLKSELLVDIGDIGPGYLSAHAHNDQLSFVLWVQQQPWLVEVGTSTYQEGQRRQLERSVKSHNTLQVNDLEQSELWGSFRGGRRAKVQILTDKPDQIVAERKGYLTANGLHRRTWQMSEGRIEISDVVQKTAPGAVMSAYFHLHPKVVARLEGQQVSTNLGNLHFGPNCHIELSEYLFAERFNELQKATKITVTFDQSLTTTLIF